LQIVIKTLIYKHILFLLEIIMSVSQELLSAVEAWKVEDEKFAAGNNAAGTRARKALQEVAKLVKTRRGEITEEKNARKAAKGG
jgi:NADH:ubiquinone oxidoreductase subunit 3 (subunit A)